MDGKLCTLRRCASLRSSSPASRSLVRSLHVVMSRHWSHKRPRSLLLEAAARRCVRGALCAAPSTAPTWTVPSSLSATLAQTGCSTRQVLHLHLQHAVGRLAPAHGSAAARRSAGGSPADGHDHQVGPLGQLAVKVVLVQLHHAGLLPARLCRAARGAAAQECCECDPEQPGPAHAQRQVLSTGLAGRYSSHPQRPGQAMLTEAGPAEMQPVPRSRHRTTCAQTRCQTAPGSRRALLTVSRPGSSFQARGTGLCPAIRGRGGSQA